MSDLGQRLRAARKRRRLSLYDVEKLTGLHFSTIGKYERNERHPNLEVLRELASVYHVSLSELIGEEPAAPPVAGEGLDPVLQAKPGLHALVAVASRLTDRQVEGLTRFLETLLDEEGQGDGDGGAGEGPRPAPGPERGRDRGKG